MIYAVFDTNVLVSALITHNSESSTVRVVKAIAEKHIVPLYNEEIVREYYEVLHREKFGIQGVDSSLLIHMIVQCGIETERSECNGFFIDQDDAVFYEVALSKEEAYLITGNIKHFPKSPIVVTPAEMMQILERTMTP